MKLRRIDFYGRIDIQQEFVVPAGYQGPGNIVSGATAWWGLRAYSLATIGANAVRLRRDSDNTEQNFVTLTDGSLDVASITTFKGAANLFLVTLFDQTGNGNNLAQATAANQIAFILSGIGDLPVMRFSSDVMTAAITSFTQAQSFTNSWVAKRTGNFTSTSGVWGAGSGTPRSGFLNSANTIFMYADIAISVTASDSAFHAVQAIYDGASSELNVNGSATSGNAGTSAHTGSATMNNDNVLRGDVVEFGIWPGKFSSGVSSAMSSNQHSYWGF